MVSTIGSKLLKENTPFEQYAPDFKWSNTESLTKTTWGQLLKGSAENKIPRYFIVMVFSGYDNKTRTCNAAAYDAFAFKAYLKTDEAENDPISKKPIFKVYYFAVSLFNENSLFGRDLKDVKIERLESKLWNKNIVGTNNSLHWFGISASRCEDRKKQAEYLRQVGRKLVELPATREEGVEWLKSAEFKGSKLATKDLNKLLMKKKEGQVRSRQSSIDEALTALLDAATAKIMQQANIVVTE